ncbi:MAG TPA: MBL fold metallo-hydrolase, partial [Arenibaculum sp.]|nr:MBL fold metallo-hydrolase [Arenibaculum sp.]
MSDIARDEITYPWAIPPEGGRSIEVSPGVHWVLMPLPFALDHVNLWLLEDGDGWTIVDTGLGSKTQAHWETLFATVMGGRPVRRVVATHYHPDHVGLAGWLVKRWNAPFFMSLTEWLFGRVLTSPDIEATTASIELFYRRAGLAPSMAGALAGRAQGYARAVTPLPIELNRLQAGDELTIGPRRWRILVGRGHTPEHVCLYCAETGVLIAGDQVLPHISPNVSVWASEPEADPLGDFLTSLDELAGLPADTLVLPSHDLPFTGLHARVGDLHRHHAERLRETREACIEPHTAAEITHRMFRRELDGQQMMFAVGEALAHLNWLVARGVITRRRS